MIATSSPIVAHTNYRERDSIKMPAYPSDDLPSISSLSNINAVKQALNQTDSVVAEVDKKLEFQLAETAENALQRAAALNDISQLSENLCNNANELVALLSTAKRRSESACADIRQLDALFTRAEAALSWTDDILTLRVCSEGAKTSLSADDLPSAARHVEQYLHLSPEVRQDQASATAVSQIEQSIAELSRKVRERAKKLLQTDAELTLAAAIDAVRLYVPIGLKDEGLLALIDYLCARIARESDDDVRSLLIENSSPSKKADAIDEPHIVSLARLFESVAAYVHDCHPIMVELFGTPSLVTLVELLQKQCDLSSDRILSRYRETKDIPEVLRAVRSETANARDLDTFLNELTLLSQRISRYFEFLRERSVSFDDENVTEGEQAVMIAKLDSVLSGCGLAKAQKEFSLNYSSIEVYFMIENAKLAIKIDEANGEDVEISTAVDDFFFVLRNCFQRALAFGDTDCEVLRVILQQMSRCLTNILLVYLKKRLRETEVALEKLMGVTTTPSLPAAGYAVSYLTELATANIRIPTSMEGQTNQGDAEKYDFYTAINNVSVSADYTTRLRANVEKSIQTCKKFSAEEHTLLATAVAEVTDAARSLVLASEQGVSRLATVLLSRVEGPVEENLRRASYRISETEYSADSEATPCFSQEVAQELEMNVLSSTSEKRLTEKNWDALVRQVAEWFASKMEAAVFLPNETDARGKEFTAFGGLRVDRDVRAISAYFSGKSKRSTVRDVFGRLSQLSMIVNLERPGEMYDMWGANAGGMTWRLSSTEVRRTLLLRTDFNPETIRSLKL